MDLAENERIKKNYVKHWAERLRFGDKCVATIRHKIDGSKNLHNVRVFVLSSMKSKVSILGYFNWKIKCIRYNDLEQ